MADDSFKISNEDLNRSLKAAIPVGHNKVLVPLITNKMPEGIINNLESISQETLSPKSYSMRQNLTDMLNLLNAADQKLESDKSYPDSNNPDTLQALNSLLPYPGVVDELSETGSSIPYYTSMIGDILINPSTVNIQTLKKMMETDDTIYHAFDYNISSIVNSIGLYNHENKDIENLIRFNFRNLKGGFNSMIQDMCMGFGLGFSVHSLKWKYSLQHQAMIISEVKPLPQATIIFRVDAEGSLQKNGVGQFVYNSLLQNIANGSSLGYFNTGFVDSANWASGAPFPNNAGSFVDQQADSGDLDFPYRIPWYSPVGLVWLNLDNTMVYSHYGVTAQKNPYGRSALRAVYNLWLQKNALAQYKMVALNRRSFPLLLVYCNQTTPVADLQDLNNPSTTVQNVQSALSVATSAMTDLNSVSTVVLPGMKDEIFSVEPVNIQGDMKFFVDLEQDLNTRIKTALGVPPLMTAGGDGASYALAYMHGQSNSRMVSAGRSSILNCLLEQFIKPVILQNFIEEEHQGDWGFFEDEQLSIDERLKNGQLNKLAVETGVAFTNKLDDINKMREGMGYTKINSQKELDRLLQTSNIECHSTPSKNLYDTRDINDLMNKPYSHKEDIIP